MNALCATCAAEPRLDKDSYCRECRNRYNREWNHRHPEKAGQYRQRLRDLAAAGLYERRAWEPGKSGRPPRDSS